MLNSSATRRLGKLWIVKQVDEGKLNIKLMNLYVPDNMLVLLLTNANEKEKLSVLLTGVGKHGFIA